MNERILPYTQKEVSKDKFVVNGYFGGWTILDKEELRKLKTFSYDLDLQTKLIKSGIIIDENNTKNIVNTYRSLNKNLFFKPSLHIINVTDTCNQRCTYCHAGVSRGRSLMKEDVAMKVVKWIMENSNDYPTIEFQGGECLIAWNTVKLIITHLRKLNQTIKKNMVITIVSNLGLLDKEKLDFFLDNDVSICTSLDGPKEVHNFHRKTATGEGSYDEVIQKIEMVKEEQKKRGINPFVGVLATISKNSLKYPKEIIDEYVRLGIQSIHLRPLNSLGDALTTWDNLSYSADDFNLFWKEAMDYISELNAKGIEVNERGAHIKLRKLIAEKDPLYVDLTNFSSGGRTVMVYNFDGGLYFSDEGRMYTDDTFKIGTVDMDAKEVFTNDDLLAFWMSSFTDLFYYYSPFRAYMGIDQVSVYQQFKNPIPSITETFTHKVHSFQYTYLFEKIALEQSYSHWLKNNWV